MVSQTRLSDFLAKVPSAKSSKPAIVNVTRPLLSRSFDQYKNTGTHQELNFAFSKPSNEMTRRTVIDASIYEIVSIIAAIFVSSWTCLTRASSTS
jgi:hypothetical protein